MKKAMGDTNGLRFPGNLDPQAKEFIPINPLYKHRHSPFSLAQTQICYTYPCPTPYPVPFVNGGAAYATGVAGCGGVGFGHAQFETSPPPGVPVVVPASLPTPSSTPSRAVLLSLVPIEVSESTVRRELEIFGDVRAVQMERVRDGVVTVHFYNIRQAQLAVAAIQEQHMQQQFRLRRHFEAISMMQNPVYEANINAVGPPPPPPPPAPGLLAGRAVWAQFIPPVTSGLPDGQNQGTIVIFNLESDMSTNTIMQIFEAFGAVKECRETPLKRHQRFVEFYDTRDAAKALAQMNGKLIQNKPVVIEFSRPGGHNKNLTKPPPNLSTKCSPRFQPPSISPSPKLSGRSPPRSFNSQPNSQPQKESFGKSNINGKGGSKSMLRGQVQDSMASLCIGGNGMGEDHLNRPSPKKGCKKDFILSNGESLKQQQKQQLAKTGSSSKAFKAPRQGREFDPRFLINEEAILESNCRDSRTTVMIKNIPNKYSQKLLLNMLDNHCVHCNEQIADGDDQPLSSYDFVYLPIDFINKCNVGYGFVNMTSPQATLRLYKAFHLQNWEVFNSRKICEVTYARLQGVEALQEHFKNSKFPIEGQEYMPVVFSPPRDGRCLTEPIPIVGCSSPIPNVMPLILPPTPCKENLEGDFDENGGIGTSSVNLQFDEEPGNGTSS